MPPIIILIIHDLRYDDVVDIREAGKIFLTRYHVKETPNSYSVGRGGHGHWLGILRPLRS